MTTPSRVLLTYKAKSTHSRKLYNIKIIGRTIVAVHSNIRPSLQLKNLHVLEIFPCLIQLLNQTVELLRDILLQQIQLGYSSP